MNKNTLHDVFAAISNGTASMKNAKEVWWVDELKQPITIEVVDMETNEYIVRKYYENGVLYWEAPYENGKVHGTKIIYRSDGTLFEYSETFVHGKRQIVYG
jgi:antitoxin component YwqK of YwqJK toxin-antitoxin module